MAEQFQSSRPHADEQGARATPVSDSRMTVSDPDDDHLSAVREQASKRVTWVSVGVNLVLSTVQVIVGYFSRSQGLIADGIHSLSDLVADLVVLMAIRFGKDPADEDHHYGHQRYENIASLVLGLLLVVVGGGMIWTAINKLQHPQLIPDVHSAALWVACGALLGKELLFRYMLKVGEDVRSSMLIANAWHARSDALSSLVVAVGIVGNLMGYPLMDPLAAMVVGMMILKMGGEFAWEALQDLADRSASEEETAAIRDTILATPGISGVHALRTRKSGDMIIVDAHLEIDGQLSVQEGHDIALTALQNVMSKHRVLQMMTHVDPV